MSGAYGTSADPASSAWAAILDTRSVTGSGSYGSGVGLSLYIGGRYFFTDNIAALVELGYGVAYLNIGIAIKF